MSSTSSNDEKSKYFENKQEGDSILGNVSYRITQETS